MLESVEQTEASSVSTAILNGIRSGNIKPPVPLQAHVSSPELPTDADVRRKRQCPTTEIGRPRKRTRQAHDTETVATENEFLVHNEHSGAGNRLRMPRECKANARSANAMEKLGDVDIFEIDCGMLGVSELPKKGRPSKRRQDKGLNREVAYDRPATNEPDEMVPEGQEEQVEVHGLERSEQAETATRSLRSRGNATGLEPQDLSQKPESIVRKVTKAKGLRAEESRSKIPQETERSSNQGKRTSISAQRDLNAPDRSELAVVIDSKSHTPQSDILQGQTNKTHQVDDGSNEHSESDEIASSQEGAVREADGDWEVQGSEEFIGQLELFGQQGAWKTIIKAVSNIDVPIVDGEEIRHRKPRMETKHFGEFVEKVKKTRECYKKLAPNIEMDEAVKAETQSALAVMSDELQNAVQHLCEKNFPRQKAKTVQDMYFYGIPALISLIESAVCARGSIYAVAGETKVLQEIVHLQDIVIELCEKVTKWKTKPKDNMPVIQSTQKILRPLRKVSHAFQETLDGRRAERKQQKDQIALEKSYRRREEEYQQRLNENRMKAAQIQQRTHEDLLRRETAVVGSQWEPRAATQTASEREAQKGDQWTAEQDYQLMKQLQISQHVPGT